MILLLSSRNDKTIEYLSQYINEANGHATNYYWEDFVDDSQRVFSEFSCAARNSTGVYVREPAEFDMVIQLVIDAVYCFLKSHPNAIIPKGNSSNWSKFYHYTSLKKHIEEYGLNFSLPDTCIGTTVPENKLNTHDVYKPSSNMPGVAVRSNNMLRYPYNTASPTPFVAQREIIGVEIRAHVLDDQVVSMQLLRSNDTALDNPVMCSCKQVTLPDHIRYGLLTLTNAEGLRLSGIDLFKDHKNKYWLLEVNPMPGYHSFDQYSVNSNNPNSALLYEVLSG